MQSAENSKTEIVSWLAGYSSHWQLILIATITIVGYFVWRFVSSRLTKRFDKTQNMWDDSVLYAITKPISLTIIIIGVIYLLQATQSIYSEHQIISFAVLDSLKRVFIVFGVTWILLRLINRVESNLLKNKTHQDIKLDETGIQAVSKLLRLMVIIISVLIMFQLLNIPISGVLTFGGIGGIAVGFAAKDLLANFFGGLMIFLDRPFKVGDWIRSPDKEIEGTVEDIGWRQTRIRTFDKRPLYVPNATFTSISVENPSRMTNRRINETIGLRYDDWNKVETIVAKVERMLFEHPDIDNEATLMVNFDKFAASSLDFFIYTFTKTRQWDEYHKIKQDILLKIMDIIEQEGAEIAFPTSTLNINSAESQSLNN